MNTFTETQYNIIRAHGYIVAEGTNPEDAAVRCDSFEYSDIHAVSSGDAETNWKTLIEYLLADRLCPCGSHDIPAPEDAPFEVIRTAHAEGYRAHQEETRAKEVEESWFGVVEGITEHVKEMIERGEDDLEDEDELERWCYESADNHHANIWTSTALHLFATESHIRDLQDEFPYEGGDNMEGHIHYLVFNALLNEYSTQIREAIEAIEEETEDDSVTLLTVADARNHFAGESDQMTLVHADTGATTISATVDGYLITETYYYYPDSEARHDFAVKYLRGRN